MNTAKIHCPYCTFKHYVSSTPQGIFRMACERCGDSFQIRILAHGIMVLPES